MNILIICIRALGDVLRTTFIAQALKDKYRKGEPKIFWITDERAKPLFINNQYIEVTLSEESKEKIKEISFDLVINLESEEEICKFVTELKAKKIIGAFLNEKGKADYTKESAYWFDMSLISRLGLKKADKLKKENKKTHRQISAEMIGVNYKNYEPFLRLSNKQRELANKFLRVHNLFKKELIIGINTGAADTWPKALPIKKTANLINQIYKKYNARILLFGGPNEIERNREIQKYTKCPIIDTGSGNNIFEFPALISACSLFITTDSLGLHVALALKRKTIALIGPTSPTEIDMYDFGEKVIAKSKEVATYRKATKKCMERISLEEVIKAVNRLLEQKITLVITAFKEPAIGKAIESALNQKTNKKYEIIVSAPDEETLNVAKKYANKNKNLKVFQDPGKGKSYALNIIFDKIKSDILILTDGDVYISDNTIEEISNIFLDPEIGCVAGRPVPIENKDTKYGYWANFLFEAAHRWRKYAFQNNSFLECSGYLFAFRKNKINGVPLDVAEDTVIPYYFWEKGYKIGYAENAKVFVKNVDNWKDWLKQKTRTSKAHETLEKYVDIKTTPRVKNFKNEAKGISLVMKYPSNPVEAIWTSQLILARLYMWLKVHLDTRLRNKHYQDAWERSESTKIN